MANVKKELTINFSAKSIELAESFEKKASIYGSTEYIMLQNARKDFPNYRIEVIKKTKKAEANEEESKLPTDALGTIDGSVANFFTEIFGLLIKYITMIPQLIAGLF